MILRLKLLLASVMVAPMLSLAMAVPALAQTSPEITRGLCAGVNLDVNNPSCRGDDASINLNNLMRRIINLLSLIVGVVAVIMIIIGGLRYITSGGSDTGVTGAKNTILYAVIGLIIVALAQLLVRFVLRQVTNA